MVEGSLADDHNQPAGRAKRRSNQVSRQTQQQTETAAIRKRLSARLLTVAA